MPFSSSIVHILVIFFKSVAIRTRSVETKGKNRRSQTKMTVFPVESQRQNSNYSFCNDCTIHQAKLLLAQYSHPIPDRFPFPFPTSSPSFKSQSPNPRPMCPLPNTPPFPSILHSFPRIEYSTYNPPIFPNRISLRKCPAQPHPQRQTTQRSPPIKNPYSHPVSSSRHTHSPNPHNPVQGVPGARFLFAPRVFGSL